jgi:multidrug efflux pump subunit AcrA (membrane-fusion protein)
VKLLLPRMYSLALATLLLTAPACSQVQSIVGSQPAASPPPQGARAVSVSVQPIRQGPISLILTYSGTIQPTQQLSIAPRTAGRIEKVHFDVGSVVKTGDKLVTLDKVLLEASARQAEAGMAVAQARVDTVKAGARAEDIAQERAQRFGHSDRGRGSRFCPVGIAARPDRPPQAAADPKR